MLLIRYSYHSCGAVVTFQRQPWHLGSCSVPTLDLWLNFDSSICIITPGPPNCGIGWRSSASHATSGTFAQTWPKLSVMLSLQSPLLSRNHSVPISKESANVFLKKFCFQRNMNLLSLRKHVYIGDISCWSFKHIFFKGSFFIFSKHWAGKIGFNYSPNVSINIM